MASAPIEPIDAAADLAALRAGKIQAVPPEKPATSSSFDAAADLAALRAGKIQATPPPAAEQPVTSPRATPRAAGAPPVLPSVQSGLNIPQPVPGEAMPSPVASLAGQKPAPRTAAVPSPSGQPQKMTPEGMVPQGTPQQLLGATIGLDRAAPPPAKGSLPQIVPVSNKALPQEDALHVADRKLDTLPSFAHKPGYHAAEQGPIADLRRGQVMATVQLAHALPQMTQAWEKDDHTLKAAWSSLNEYRKANDGLLTPSEARQYNQRATDLYAQMQRHDARGKQIAAYGQRVGPVLQRYSQTPMHTGINYPQEGPPHEGRGSSWFGMNPLGGTNQALQNINRERAIMMLRGDYPPPKPFPPNTRPAQYPRLIQEKNVVKNVLTQLGNELTDGGVLRTRGAPKGEPPQSGALGQPDMAITPGEARQMAAKFTPWQKSLIPLVRQQLKAEGIARERAGVPGALTRDVATFGAAMLVGGPAGEAVGGVASRLLQPLESRLIGQGAGAVVSRFLLHQAPRLVGGAAGGAAAGGSSSGLGALMSGASPAETVKAAGRGALAGAGVGSAAALLHTAPDVWRVARQTLGSGWDPHTSPGEVAHLTQAAQRVYGLSADEATNLEARLTRIGKAPAPVKNRMMATLKETLETARRPKVVAPSAEPTAAAPPPPETVPHEPRVTTADATSISLRHMTPEAVHSLVQDATARGDTVTAQRGQQWLQAHSAHQAHVGEPVPHELIDKYKQSLTAPGNQAMATVRAFKAHAEKVKAADPDLSEKLNDAARVEEIGHKQNWLAKTVPPAPGDLRPEPAPPAQASAWRRMTPEQQASLPAALRKQLLVQDISNSQQVENPNALPIHDVSEVPGRARRIETLEAIANTEFHRAQESMERLHPAPETMTPGVTGPALPKDEAIGAGDQVSILSPVSGGLHFSGTSAGEELPGVSSAQNVPIPSKQQAPAQMPAEAPVSPVQGAETAQAPAGQGGAKVMPFAKEWAGKSAGKEAPSAPVAPHEMTKQQFVSQHGYASGEDLHVGMARVPAHGDPGYGIEPVRYSHAEPLAKAIVFRDKNGVARGTLEFTSVGEALGTDKRASILGIHVDPEFRRQGIGTRLHEELEKAGYQPQPLESRMFSHEGAALYHARVVRQALAEGKSVPDAVKKDYVSVVADAPQWVHEHSTAQASAPLESAVSDALARAGLGESAIPVAPHEHYLSAEDPAALSNRLQAAEEILAAHEVAYTDTDGALHTIDGLEMNHAHGEGLETAATGKPTPAAERPGEVARGNEGGGQAAEKPAVSGEAPVRRADRGDIEKVGTASKRPTEPATPAAAGTGRGGEPAAAGRGKLTTVRAGEQKVQARWTVLDIGDLKTSHTENLGETPGYPQELQPRDRSRLASREQIADLANRLDPELMAENPLAQHGAPIVGPDQAVESGNARTIALRQAYRTGGKIADAYKEWVRNQAGRFGIKPEAVTRIENPILVRVRTSDLSPEERVRFTQAANARETAAMGGAETAKVDASRLNPTILRGYDAGGDLTAASNRAFLRDFIGSLPASEHAGMRTADGGVSQEGLTRARNALFYHAYGDTGALVRLAESTDDPTRNITTGMLRSAGFVAELRGKVAAGAAHPLDISGDLAAAAGQLAALRDQGVSVPQYLAQQTLLGGELDDFQKGILQSLEANKRSGKKIAALLADYVDVALKSGDPSTGSLFEGIAPPTKEEVWQAALRRMEGIETNEPGLFTEQEGTTPKGAPMGSGAVDKAPSGESAQESAGSEATGTGSTLRVRRGSIQIGPALGQKAPSTPNAPVFENPELEKFRTENRTGEPEKIKKENLLARLVKMRNIYPDLPDNPQNRPLISALLRVQKLPGIAKSEAMFRLHDAVGALQPHELELFEGALLTPDLLEDVEKGVPLPPGLTEEMLKEEHPKIQAKVEANPKVKQALVDWKRESERTFSEWRQSIIDIGEKPPALDRENWYHHMVMSRAEEMARDPGASRELKAVMNPGFSFERKGGVPFNTYFQAAHFSLMADAIRMTEENKVTRLVQDPKNGFNIKPQLDARRAMGNDAKSLQFFQMLGSQMPAGGLDALVEALPERIGAMAVANDLPNDPNGRWDTAIQALADAHSLNLNRATGTPRIPVNPEMAKDLRDYGQWVLQQYAPEPGRKAGPAALVPKGYQEYRFAEGNPLYRVTKLAPAAEKLAQAVVQGVEDSITVGRSDLKSALALGKKRGVMILPDGVAKTLHNLTPPAPNPLDEAFKTVMGATKAFSVLNPEHLPTLMREKVIGDAVRIFRANPDVFREAPQAIIDLWNTRARKQGPAEEYRNWLFETGGRGFVGNMENIGEDRGLNLLAHLALEKPSKITPELLVNALRMFPDRLDEVLRYAAFRSFGKAIDTHGEPQAIGAARRDLAMSLKTRSQQAAFLSEHLMGAYNEVPAMVRAIRDHWPSAYWGFASAQMRAETDLFLNAIWREPKVHSGLLRGLGVEDSINQKRGTAWAANNVLFWSKLLMVAGAVAAYNHYRYPKEEEQMNDGSPHLDLGHGPKGTMLVWPRVGTLPNPAAFMGLDDPLSYGQMYLNGHLTKQEIIKRMAQSGPAEFLGLSGLAKVPLELATRRRLATGGRIDDSMEYIAQQFHVPLLYEASRRAFGGTPRPVRGGMRGAVTAAALGAHLIDPGDMAFREAGAKAREWINTEKSITPSQREQSAFSPLSSSLYYYKKSIRDGDGQTAMKYLAAYSRAGGTDEKIHQQIYKLEPLYGMNRVQMAKYLKTLSPFDRNQVRSGYQYWQQFAAPKAAPQELADLAKQSDLLEFAQGMRLTVFRGLQGEQGVRNWLNVHPFAAEGLRSQSKKAELDKSQWAAGIPQIK